LCSSPLFRKQQRLRRCPGTVSPVELSQWMVGLRKHEPWHLPLFQSVIVGDIAVVIPLPNQALPMAKLKTIGKPVIVLICDDGPLWLGPDGWSCASYACDWARAIMVNGTGGHSEYYASAVDKAREVGRVTICDCSSDHFEAWRRCAIAQGTNKPMIGFRPPPGQHHPVDAEMPEDGR
jgi:hypothetical protein